MDDSSKRLECPFTWQIPEKLATEFIEDDEPIVEVDEQPIMAIINSVMYTYIRTIQNDHEGAIRNLKNTDEIWEKIDKSRMKSEGVSSSVLAHVIDATKYHLYKINNNNTIETEKLWRNLKDIKSYQEDVDKGTVDGCKAIAWSIFHEAGHKRALVFANQAVSLSPDYPLWHLILGNNLKHARRNQNNQLVLPSDREKMAFLKCYNLSNDPFYRIQVAQMYRENDDKKRAEEIYQEIFAADYPKSHGILLRLARAFTTSRNFDEANVCLEKAGAIRKNSMFHHYKGLLYDKQKKWKLATVHLKEAGKNGNHRADIQYAITMMKLNKHFNIINHLKVMSKKHEKNILVKQQILLHIAMQYNKKNDIRNSLSYFLEAIEMKPDSYQLKEFYNVTNEKEWKPYEIFDFVQQKVRSYAALPIPSEMKTVVKKLQILCERQNRSQTDKISACMNGLKL